MAFWGGVRHTANAEEITKANETYYSVSIPSEINLDDSSQSQVINISGNTYNKHWLEIGISSQNDFNLRNNKGSVIPYKLDKTSISITPQYTDKDGDSFSDAVHLTKENSDTKYSGNYSDKLTFTMNPVETRTIQLDCNGGTVNSKSEIKYTVRNGGSYGKLPLPTRNGYQFVAWKDESNNTIYSGSEVKTNTEKLTCEWIPIQTFAFNGYINGYKNEYLTDIGTFDVYINGNLYRNNTNTIYYEGVKGDVIECTNFNIGTKFQYQNIHNNQTYDGLTIITDKNGQLVSIKGILGNENITFDLDFISSTPLQKLINNTNTTKLVFDSDKPQNNIASTGILENMFTTSVDTYVKDNELHLYNMDGGPVIAPKDSTNLLSYTNIEVIDANNLDVSQVENAYGLFNSCQDAKQILCNKWNASNFMDITKIFYGCSNLDTVDVNNWDTSNIENMYFAFSYSGIKNIDLSNWDVSQVKSFKNMFFNCENLENLDLHTWKTSSATNMSWIFRECKKIKTINISGWDTSNCLDLNGMFWGDALLEDIQGLNDLDVSKNYNFAWIFNNCHHLKTIDISNWNTSNSDSFKGMFGYCYQLETIYVENNFVIKPSAITLVMFNSSPLLVGGSGTKYDNTFIDGTAARIDGGVNNPGYFTSISQKVNESD